MSLSNTATPIYYGQFRDAVIRGEIPVCREISMEMNRIDALIANPNIYYDDKAVEGWIAYCEKELTLTDGGDLYLLDSFKLWGEQIFGWFYFVERQIFEPAKDGRSGKYVTKQVKKRLITKQYLIVARGAAKSMYASFIQNYFLNVDTTTTHQITTAPTMGRRLYRNRDDLASELGVGSIVEVEVMDQEPDVLGIVVNLADYNVGTDKGGEVNFFDDFDIDYNQYKYLGETRLSGALVKIKSALIIKIADAGDTAVVPNDPTFDESTGVVTIVATTGVTYENADTGATLTAGAQPALAVGDTLNIVAVPDSSHFIASSEDANWSFTRLP